VYCCVAPEEIDWLAGVIEIDAKVATVTFTVVEPLTPPNVALMVADPEATPVTKPVELTVAMVISDEAQLAESVMVSVLLLLYVPVAVICCVFPIARDGVDGARVTVVKVGPMKNPLHPERAGVIAVNSNKAIMQTIAASFFSSRICHCFIEQPSLLWY
jgi:hypothetical protein